MRLFYCYPFGKSDPDSIVELPRHAHTTNYTFFFDQEPLDSERHPLTFRKLISLNHDLVPNSQLSMNASGQNIGYIVTSEKNSEMVELAQRRSGAQMLYYFYHGWAALDWYRGYHRSFVIAPPEDRTISKTFISPNRIVAGKRHHRLLSMYHYIKHGLVENNWISFPEVCPGENIAVQQEIQKLKSIYPDIEETFNTQPLPLNFPGEQGHPMHSYCLSLFDQCQETLLYVVAETVAQGRRLHLTEKTFKPICLGMPFVLIATAGSLSYLREYGFKTFADFWDESYDLELDDTVRVEKTVALLNKLNALTPAQKQELYKECLPLIQHNYNHFYNGGFENILWHELTNMLSHFHD